MYMYVVRVRVCLCLCTNTIVGFICLEIVYTPVLYWIGVQGVFVSSHDTLGCFTPESWDRFQYSLTALKPTILTHIVGMCI